MSEINYKEQKLNEIETFRNQVYLNYIDQVRTVNGYIVALASAAILAIFTLFYKFHFAPIHEEIFHLSILTWIKIATAFFMISLFLIILINVIYTIDSSMLEKRYSKLHTELQDMRINDDIKNKINTHYKVMGDEFKYKYAFYEGVRYFGYIFFLLGIFVIGVLIIAYSGSEGVS